MYKLTIIIPVFNNCNFTKTCIQDLMQLPNDHEIIVVDNSSTDNTEAICRSFYHEDPTKPRFEYIKLTENFGFGYACNHGFWCSQNDETKSENVLFLNNDIKVKSNFNTWTKPLIELAEQQFLVSANGGLLDKNFNFIKETNEYVDDPHFYLSGWALVASIDTFNKLILKEINPNFPDSKVQYISDTGPWNKKFENYFEDTDLSFRAKELNIPLKVVKIPVHHFGHITSKKMNLPKMYKDSQAIFREIWSNK